MWLMTGNINDIFILHPELQMFNGALVVIEAHIMIINNFHHKMRLYKYGA